MNRDDVIRMAREVGILETMGYGNAHMRAWQDDVVRELTHFAALVAAAERDRIADEAKHIIKRAEARGAAAEREACAKVCEQEWNDYCGEPSGYALAIKECADAIRARGETK